MKQMDAIARDYACSECGSVTSCDHHNAVREDVLGLIARVEELEAVNRNLTREANVAIEREETACKRAEAAEAALSVCDGCVALVSEAPGDSSCLCGDCATGERERIDRLATVVGAARKTVGCRARLAAMYSPGPPVDHGRMECGACDVCRLAEAIRVLDSMDSNEKGE